MRPQCLRAGVVVELESKIDRIISLAPIVAVELESCVDRIIPATVVVELESSWDRIIPTTGVITKVGVLQFTLECALSITVSRHKRDLQVSTVV